MSTDAAAPRAKFKQMTEGTQEDWAIIGEQYFAFAQELPKRIIDHLMLLKGDFGGFPVDRLEHCLQTATRAHRDGRDEEYVVCALLHDIGDTLGPTNHADVAAVLLQPYVSEENHWIIKHHGIFQGYYFFHYLGLDRNGRDAFKDSPYYQACAEFCHRYDQNSFDPDYDSEPLEFFIPMIEKVFAEPKRSLYKEAM
ncbi:HD domain-containing protein [Pseudomaricurvus alkylphenolicus]|uniref:HD domain-containing protein n=1 Tax=Pseudomaricurvus alkylphenolicus TaxID=1306991 RepID=UPI001421DD2F|nr:HD domain-containing protein [Pseudomaricurvus alkylphenolicus]NIB41496.1 HD domain-containing protein [Pseudomaricurvus alkylphenolicus]